MNKTLTLHDHIYGQGGDDVGTSNLLVFIITD